MEIYLSALLLAVVYILFRFNLYYYSYNIRGCSFGFLWYYLFQKKNVRSLFRELFEKYDDICKCWIGPVLFIIPSKPEYIQTISHECTAKLNKLMKFVGGEGVVSMNTTLDWKRQRKLLNPLYKVTNLNQQYDTINFWSTKLVSDLKQNKEPVFSIATKNIFCLTRECFFTKNPVSAKDSEENMTLSLRLTKLWLFGLYSFKPIWLLTKQGQTFVKTSNSMRNSAVKVVTDAQNDMKQHFPVTSFMSFLLKNKEFSYEEILGNVLTVSNAAVTSTTSTQIFAILLLAMHESIQSNLFEEINHLWDENTNSLPLESLKHALLLDRVIKETLRLFPPVPSILRKADKTINLDDKYTIPKGANIIIEIFNIHRDSRYWKDPLKFKPDRFLPQHFKEIKRGSYAPFWLSSRNCIGQYFALLTLKVSIAHVVKSFKISGCRFKNVSEIELRTSALIEPTNFCVNFEARST